MLIDSVIYGRICTLYIYMLVPEMPNPVMD